MYRSHSVCILSIERSSKHSGKILHSGLISVFYKNDYEYFILIIFRKFFNAVDKAKSSSASGKKQFDKKLHATLQSEGVETPSKLDLYVSLIFINLLHLLIEVSLNVRNEGKYVKFNIKSQHQFRGSRYKLRFAIFEVKLKSSLFLCRSQSHQMDHQVKAK